MMSARFPDDELARRHATSHKLAWVLGAVVLVIYVIGFFIQR